MNCLLVPTVGLDLGLLERLAYSIDYPIAHKIVLNNGKPGSVNQFIKNHPDWKVNEHYKNFGVAESWNQAPYIFPKEKSWLIVNDDVWFGPGYLGVLCKVCTDDFVSSQHMIFTHPTAETPQCFVWTRKAVDEFGYFDENFWPAYYEDLDMRFRFKIGNASTYHIPLYGQNHGKPYPGGQNWNGMKDGAGLFNRAYFLKKWGSLEKPLWNHPYNDPSLSIRDWKMDHGRRSKIEPIWDTFMSMPNPSIK